MNSDITKPSFGGLFFNYRRKNSSSLIQRLATVVLLSCFFGSIAQAQYYPRGIRQNDNYLPNLDEPNKFLLSLDGMVDWQKEETSGQTLSLESTHFHFNGFYGGQKFRAGLQVMQDHGDRNTKDLTIGLAMAINRPAFVQMGLGYLQRDGQGTSSDGWVFNGKLGYEVPLIFQINYRIRLRVIANFNYKNINSDTGEVKVLQFYPLIGLEFET